ncbi:hypothetical protein L1987_18787 [Smallanthus sonchifolius]|uniref:Uncharacterized protein n=1 Tax=Smallanthus sonchifolius TaxID=185202 RepID=A0ACB9J2P9_9ASTR|nr:hypothetical protein L1987_18787 [Smallanthus sonchifolius]
MCSHSTHVHFHLLAHKTLHSPSFSSNLVAVPHVLDLIAMVNLVLKSEHNICACLDLHAPKSGDYHDLIKYLKHSKVYFALTIDPVIYEPYICRLWSSTVVSEVDRVEVIKATFHGMIIQDIELGVESSSSGSSSSNADSDADKNNGDGHDEEGDNVDNNDVVFETEDLNTTHGTQLVSPNQSQDEVMPSWAITLQSQNESLQKAVAELTSLVSSFSTTAQTQDNEIMKLNKENKRLKLATSS